MMIQCSQLQFCHPKGMTWYIANCMIEMKETTRECLFCQFCGAFRENILGVRIIMKSQCYIGRKSLRILCKVNSILIVIFLMTR